MMKMISLAVALYGLSCIAFYFFHGYVLFQRDKLPRDFVFSSRRPVKEVWFGENAEYHALHLKADSAKGIIVYFHGNRGSLKRWVSVAEGLNKYPYDILLVEFPSFGKSTADLTQENFWALGDLAFAYARNHFPEKDIVVYGRSMGTGLATWLSSKYEIGMLVLETPYYSLYDLIHRYAFYLPFKYFVRYNFESNKYLEVSNCPVLILHGTEDKVIPVDMARRLSKVNPSNCSYVEIDGAGHDNLSDFDQYWNALDKYLF